jgi:murein DD-endopeptidase MepM/ murein hydrolase activator NlpD
MALRIIVPHFKQRFEGQVRPMASLKHQRSPLTSWANAFTRRRCSSARARQALYGCVRPAAEAAPAQRPVAPFARALSLFSQPRRAHLRARFLARRSRYLLHALVLALALPALLLGSDRTRLAAMSSPIGGVKVAMLELPRAELAQPVVLALQPAARQAELLDAYAPALVVDASGAQSTYVALHTVGPDEALSAIAARYNIPVATLVWANDLDRGDALAVGQQLRVPRLAGVPHIVAADDTPEALAARYGVAVEAILFFGPNQLRSDQALPVGRELFIPGGKKPNAALDAGPLAELRAVRAAVVRESQTNLREGPGTRYARVTQLDAGWRLPVVARHERWFQVELLGQGRAWVREELLDLSAVDLAAIPETDDFPPPPPIWVWPASGSLSSGFGSRWGGFHNGIDLANRAWTPIVAARGGRVIEAGWCRGYGYCVKLAHDGDIVTEYGHLVDMPVVAAGETVDAGQLIGHMGSTYDRSGGGYSTGVHLHFTVKINGQAVNPLTVLP